MCACIGNSEASSHVNSLLNSQRSVNSQRMSIYDKKTNKSNVNKNNKIKLNASEYDIKDIDEIDEIPSDWENDTEWNKKEMYNDKKNIKRPHKVIHLPTVQ